MPYITKYCVDKILEACRIEEVIGDFVQIKKSGAGYKGLSPFVEERTPSFIVNPVKQIFKDFASSKGGSVVTFLMEHKGMSYPEALEYIAKKYNIIVEYEAHEFSEKKKEVLEVKENRRSVLKKSHELYQSEFKKLDATHPAKLEVFGHREYNDGDVIEWGIGYAPENFLYNILKSSGKVTEAEELGLIISKDNIFERYSKRVVYPLHDYNGLIIGLAGRDLTNNKKSAKWINPPVDTTDIYRLYDKDKFWYGLHKAKFEIRKRGEVFIVEGYNDVIGCHKYGLENTVGSCGTAITEGQLNILRKLCDKAVFWMDPDRAGIAAVLKQIPKFIKAGFRTEVIIMDLDPDDYCRKYSDVISLSEGLNEMFKTKGIRRDGFSLLVNEFIKKDYYQLEENLAAEREILENFRQLDVTALEKLKSQRNEIETDWLQGKQKLKEIELAQGKKSDEYIQQQLTNSTLKANLDNKKNEIKNFQKSPEYRQQKKIVDKLAVDYDIAFKNSETSRSSGARELLKTVIYVSEKAYFEIYSNWIIKESGITKTTFNNWYKELKVELIEVELDDYELDYELPKNVKVPFKELEPAIKNYGMFMANNQIYIALPENVEGKVYFSSISNFEISILQHMNDEKYPTKLIRIKNVHGKEIIFDTLSENLNSPQMFYNTMSGHGNFNWKGSNPDLARLRTYLFDHMGNGRKIEVLGWQPDGKFFAFNNCIITEDGTEIPLDDNGVFVHEDTHYYIPSANKIHRFATSKYSAQKKFKVIENPISFEAYLTKVKKVHREHAISGILFGISSLFQDIAVEENGSFPILFLYGPGGSGKDELAYIVQSFTGIPQTPINIGAGASTLKAKIIELAQFKNGISQFSEYKRGDDKVDETIKGVWDRVGYKRGNIESRVGIDTVDIESSVIMTGNEYPNKEPLIIRNIWNEMHKNVFTQEEMNEFDELNDMTEKGLSGYSKRLLQHRILYKEKFSKSYRFWKGFLQEQFPEAKGRMISNLAVISATYQIFRDSDLVVFPFSQDEMIQHFRNQIEHQSAKIASASILIRFWDCFIASLRGHKEDRLQANYIVSIEENNLFIQWTHTMDKIERKWWEKYRELPPNRKTFKDELQKTGLLIEEKSVHSFDKGRNANRSSAVVINLLGLSENARQDIIGSIMYQLNEGTFWDGKSGMDDKHKEVAKQEALPLDQHFMDSDE